MHIRNARLFSMKKLCSTPRPRWIQQAGRKQGLGARGRSSRGPLEASREKRRPEARTRASARVTRCAGAADSRARCRRGGVGGDPGKQQSRARGEPPPAELDGVSHLGANTQGKYGRGGWTRGGGGPGAPREGLDHSCLSETDRAVGPPEGGRVLRPDGCSRPVCLLTRCTFLPLVNTFSRPRFPPHL